MNIDPPLQSHQWSLISQLSSTLQLCGIETRVSPKVEVVHYFITDGNFIIEFGDISRTDRCFRFARSAPRNGAPVDCEFQLTDEVRRRLRQVCGSTNFSLALRNSEHMAKYIQCGSWVSMDMAGGSELFKELRPHLGQSISLINTPPSDLALRTAAVGDGVVYPSLRYVFQPTFASRTYNSNCLLSGFNVLLLGPTGAGKSTIINTLYNRRVALVKASPHSVTKHMDIYSGTYSNRGAVTDLNIIDSIGFCDSVLTAAEVVSIVKGFIQTNDVILHKVVIVCAKRIERDHALAISQFLGWLKYSQNQGNFVFVYNQAENLDDAERNEALAAMGGLLNVDVGEGIVASRSRFQMPDSQADVQVEQAGVSSQTIFVPLAIAIGFPPRAPLTQVESDLRMLHNAVFIERHRAVPIRMKPDGCSIL